MKIGTFLNQIERAVSLGEIPDIAAGLSMLAAKGLSYVDVTSDMVDKYSVQKIKEWLSPFGLTVDSYIHCLPFNPVNEASWDFYRHDTALQLARCSELGCGFFMLVPELSEAFLSAAQRNAARDQVVAYAKYVTEQARSYDIRTLIENYSYIHYPYSVPEDIEYILNRVPDLRFILDTGNFWFNDTDMEAAATRFADRTAHVHLKDLSPNNISLCFFTGKDIIPLQVAVYHNDCRRILIYVPDDNGHIFEPRHLGCPLPSMSCDQLKRAIRKRPCNAGNKYPIPPDAFHSLLHHLVIPNGKRMIRIRS